MAEIERTRLDRSARCAEKPVKRAATGRRRSPICAPVAGQTRPTHALAANLLDRSADSGEPAFERQANWGRLMTVSKMKKSVCFAGMMAFISIASSGCVPAAIGAYAYSSTEKREARQEYLQNLAATNLEREKAGLAPIDICEAKQQFDPDWAAEDPGCAGGT